MKNFIEVGKTDEERTEQVKQWVKENGLQIIIGVVFGLSAIWGWDYYQDYQYQQSIEARTQYLALITDGNNTEALDSLKDKHANSGYAAHAALLMAKRAIETKNYQQALAHFTTIDGR